MTQPGNPQFLAPESLTPSSEQQPSGTSSVRPARTMLVGNDEIEVTRLAPVPAAPAAAADINRVVRALSKTSADLTMSEDARFALARAAADPVALTTRLAAPLDTESTPFSTLFAAETRLLTLGLLPGLQPRGRSGSRLSDDPIIEESPDDDMTSVRFKSYAHLRSWETQNVERTLQNGRRRIAQIAATGVLRHVTGHPVRIRFDDGEEPIETLFLRDGITRWCATMVVLLGLTSSRTEDQAIEIVNSVLPADPKRSPQRTLTQDLARSWQSRARELVERYEAEAGDGKLNSDEGLTSRAILIRQGYSIPARMYVGLDDTTDPNSTFEDSIRHVVAALHVDVAPWTNEDQAVDATERALTQLADARPDLVSREVAELALGRMSAAQTSSVFPTVAGNGLELKRAVMLVHTLTRPKPGEAFRKALRNVAGVGKVTENILGRHVGPLIDDPWRIAKRDSLQKGRNAWGNGGPMVQGISGPWYPVFGSTYMDLLPRALKGDEDARMTLAVAGGTALIADGAITTLSVAGAGAGGKRQVSFRGKPNAIIANLARTNNEEGLTLLALAADSFHADKSAADYRLPDVDLEADDKRRRDGGVVVRITEERVSEIADPNPKDGDKPSPGAGSSNLTKLEEFRNLSVELPVELDDAVVRVSDLVELQKAPEVSRRAYTRSQHTSLLFAAAQIQAKIVELGFTGTSVEDVDDADL